MAAGEIVQDRFIERVQIRELRSIFQNSLNFAGSLFQCLDSKRNIGSDINPEKWACDWHSQLTYDWKFWCVLVLQRFDFRVGMYCTCKSRVKHRARTLSYRVRKNESVQESSFFWAQKTAGGGKQQMRKRLDGLLERLVTDRVFPLRKGRIVQEIPNFIIIIFFFVNYAAHGPFALC